MFLVGKPYDPNVNLSIQDPRDNPIIIFNDHRRPDQTNNMFNAQLLRHFFYSSYNFRFVLRETYYYYKNVEYAYESRIGTKTSFTVLTAKTKKRRNDRGLRV